MTTLACIGSFDPTGFFIVGAVAVAGLIVIPATLIWAIGLLFD